jgi:transposase
MWWQGIMAAPRRVAELSMGSDDLARLEAIARSRSEPAIRVERARILLAYHANPSSVAVGKQIGIMRHTVRRCVRRAAQVGVLAALEDSPRPGKAPVITAEARAWLVSLACRKAKDLGYPHELWTTRLLARHVREHAEAAGHPCMAKIVQGTVCKILARHEVKPHKARYYLERRDEAFEAKMAEVLCVYREVALLRESQSENNVAIISYDEKPGIQAIGNTAPDLPPQPRSHPAFACDHEYKRHGTLSLLAGLIVARQTATR